VLAFTLLASFLTAVLFGLAPAWHSSRTDLVESLKAGGRSASGSRARTALRNSLVVAEVALSVMLLVGASLMFRTLLALQEVDLGIRSDRLLTMRVPLPESRYPDSARRAAFLRQLLERLKGEPSIALAAVNSSVHPFGGWNMPVEVPGAAAADTRSVVIHQVSADYTQALGIPLLQGRLFGEAELGFSLARRARQPGLRAPLLRRPRAARPSRAAAAYQAAAVRPARRRVPGRRRRARHVEPQPDERSPARAVHALLADRPRRPAGAGHARGRRARSRPRCARTFAPSTPTSR
jgi:hypothetical protein